jgi:hypothetical protein
MGATGGGGLCGEGDVKGADVGGARKAGDKGASGGSGGFEGERG